MPNLISTAQAEAARPVPTAPALDPTPEEMAAYSPTGKRIVICCDGTWNIADQDRATNVVKFAMGVDVGVPAAGDPRLGDKDQRLLYLPGVGTGAFDKLLGGASGLGLSRHILEGYRYLCGSYARGDEIYLVGFSRGAFTARSLAGFIRSCGVIRPEHTDRIEQGFEMYRGSRARGASAAGRYHPGHPLSTEATLFRRAYSFEDEVRVRFIGVWDTVGALGIPLAGRRWIDLLNRPWQFHDTDLSRKVDRAHHAVAIDEDRRSFLPTMWNQQPGAPSFQVLEQVWFTGVHCDVGGGNRNAGLSDVPLWWMVDRACRAGLRFKAGYFRPGEDTPAFCGPDGESAEAMRRCGEWTAPDPAGAFSSSRRGLFRLFPPVRRSVGLEPRGRKPASNQSVASCAYARVTAEAEGARPAWLRAARDAGVPETAIALGADGPLAVSAAATA
ncbi:MAG: DUF2235 domain-containing protein [Thermoleophilia bacterium]